MPQINSPHSFYIPVMGTGFTIDTPLAVAKYGISSVISLADDILIEKMRKFWCEKNNEPYQPINSQDQDSRARRITAYLNLLDKLVAKQISAIKCQPFEPRNEITTYFEMLPDGVLKKCYQEMLAETDQQKKVQLQHTLRQAITAGTIDVNIMTKLDCQNYRHGQMLPYEFNDAAAALRGYAMSNVASTLVFSAGFNPHLYGYIASFNDFFPDENYEIKKKICLKVSDYRSAAIQGKYLAKRGLWVSEYRIESPLNCGGHAFINDGQLMGTILEEFKQRKEELVDTLYGFYKNALKSIKKFCGDLPQRVRITAQGGIGANAEHELLLNHYQIDAAGWGTPFLLVPEATNVDSEQLQKLLNATDDDVFLSSSSPLGVPFWNLRKSASEIARLLRIKAGIPGAKCTNGYARVNCGLDNQPICHASHEYQRSKLRELATSNLPIEQINAAKEELLSKSCICRDLAGGALIKNNIDHKVVPAVCPGPNLVNFKKLATLKEMVNHIYGRCSLLANSDRPHMFIREIQLQINYLLDELKKSSLGLPIRSKQKIDEVIVNIAKGIDYYQNFAKQVLKKHQEKFLNALQELQTELKKLSSSTSQGLL